jgi:hypothetical protein
MTTPAEFETAREQLAAHLAQDWPEFAVYPYVMHPENVSHGHPVVSVYRESLGREGKALAHHLRLDVFVSGQDGTEAEKEADDALDAVLLTIQRLAGAVTWGECRRVTFGDPGSGQYAGYTISATAYSRDVYQQTVLGELAQPAA